MGVLLQHVVDLSSGDAIPARAVDPHSDGAGGTVQFLFEERRGNLIIKPCLRRDDTLQVEGAGGHTLAWAYIKDVSGNEGEDCAWLDCVTWTPSGTTVDAGGGKTVTVPGTWLAERTARAATDAAANGRKVWECYLLGIDPERADDDFKITRFWMDGDRPMFEFSHTRDGSGVSFAPRIRRMGKAALGDAWQEVPAGGTPAFRFFTVEVEPPR